MVTDAVRPLLQLADTGNTGEAGSSGRVPWVRARASCRKGEGTQTDHVVGVTCWSLVAVSHEPRLPAPRSTGAFEIDRERMTARFVLWVHRPEASMPFRYVGVGHHPGPTDELWHLSGQMDDGVTNHPVTIDVDTWGSFRHGDREIAVFDVVIESVTGRGALRWLRRRGERRELLRFNAEQTSGLAVFGC